MKTESARIHGAYANLWEALNSARQRKLAKAGDDPQAKRLSDMQDALQRLHDTPSPKAAAKQEALNKVGMLKQRLESLKAMLLYASPEQAKALAQELKSVAKQLSAVAQSLGSSQGATSPAANVGASNEGVSASESSAEAAPDAAADAAGGEAAAATGGQAAAADRPESAEDEAKQADDPSGNAASPDQRAASDPRSASEGSDRSLRDALIEARKLLKEVIGMIKAKLAAAGKEAKHDVQAAEKSLREMDQALAQSGGDDFYTGQGDLSAGLAVGGLPAALSISGLSIDLHA